jgi:muramidase (phage lysozyme)
LDPKIIDVVTAKAIEQRDPKLLGFLDQKVPGQNYSYGDTPYGRKAKAETINTLETMGRKAIADEKKLQDEADKKAKADVERRTITSLAADPNAPMDETLLKEGEKYDPEFRTKVNTWRSNILGDKGRADPEKVLALNWEIINGGGQEAVRRAMDNGVIKTAEELKAATTLADNYAQTAAKVDEFMKRDSAKRLLDTIKQRTLTSQDLSQVFAPDGLSDKGLAASYDFKQGVMAWVASNPNASAQQTEDAIAKIGATILKGIGGGAGDEVTYTQPKGANPNNPYVPGKSQDTLPVPTPAPETTGPAPTTAPAQPAQQRTEVTPEAQRWFTQTYTPEQQQRFRDLATAQGKDLNAIIAAGYANASNKGATPGAPANPNPPATPPEQPKAIQEGWAKPAPPEGYLTKLDPADEAKFQDWVKTNKVPFDPSPTADYDMRGFWKDLTTGGGHAKTGANANDGKLHFTDYFKTPYHESFSSESQWATDKAPTWNEKDQLVTPDGRVVFDERAANQPPVEPQPLKPTKTSLDMATGAEPFRQVVEDIGKAYTGAGGQYPKDGLREGGPVSTDIAAQVSKAFEAALGSSRPRIGNYALATIKDDPKAASILDFISGPESKGNYNAFFANAGSTKDLSKMTLDQVLAWQKARTDAGSPSSATGRYQFMRNTLASLKTQMGLKGDEKFTPELQDRLALQLLRVRGYDRFKEGKMSAHAFALELAKEWASLPDPRTGKSYYAGDGLNASLVTPGQVAKVLTGAVSTASADRKTLQAPVDRKPTNI